MKKIQWKMERRAVVDVVPAGYNPRILSEKARSDLRSGMSEYLFTSYLKELWRI